MKSRTILIAFALSASLLGMSAWTNGAGAMTVNGGLAPLAVNESGLQQARIVRRYGYPRSYYWGPSYYAYAPTYYYTTPYYRAPSYAYGWPYYYGAPVARYRAGPRWWWWW